MLPEPMIPHEPNGPGEAPDPWGLGQLEPTNFVVLWPGDSKPNQAEVLVALSRAWGGGQPLNELGSPTSKLEHPMEWLVVAELSQREGEDFNPPLVMWAEPMRPMPAEHLEFLNANEVKWSIGFETLLNPADPLKSFHSMMRLLGNAFPGAPAILDVNKEGWHRREEIESDFMSDRELTEAALFMVHGVCAESAPKPDTPMWIYTCGLSRCGLPELEMLDVPHRLTGVAVNLLTSIGELVAESGMTLPGEGYEIGAGLTITFQPWREVAAFASQGSLGGLDRKDHNGNPADGARAAVCGIQPTGTYKKIWTWPRDVVEQVAAVGLTVVYKTKRAAKRTAMLARDTWDDLASAFSCLPAKVTADNENRQAVFLVKAGFQPKPSQGKKAASLDSWDGREHLWFEVKRFKDSRFEGMLVNDPISLDHLRKGDVLWVDRGTMSEWQVLTRMGVFGPNSVEAMRQTLTNLVRMQHEQRD